MVHPENLTENELKTIVNHVFLPPRLPQEDDRTLELEVTLCRLVLTSMNEFGEVQGLARCEEWTIATDMIDKLCDWYQIPSLTARIDSVAKTLKEASNRSTGTLVFPVRAQNACVVVRRLGLETIFEAFEVDPPNQVVMKTTGRVVRSFPDISISVPKTSLSSEFYYELASFLCKMDDEEIDDALPKSNKAGNTVSEIRDTIDSHYITSLFMNIIAGLKGSHQAVVHKVLKHTRNDILWCDALKPWRRWPLWLTIRVTLQTTLHRLGYPNLYKQFIVFFMGGFLSKKSCNHLPSQTLHCMQSKLGHRVKKLSDTGSERSIPQPLLDRAFRVLKEVKDLLHHRWEKLQKEHVDSHSEEWAPFKLYPPEDPKFPLPEPLKTYLQYSPSHEVSRQETASFEPADYPRLFQLNRTFEDFNDVKFKKAFAAAEPRTVLLDIERFVLEHLAEVDPPYLCDGTVIGGCIRAYASAAQEQYEGNPESLSIMLLTIFVMWVTLDKLAVHGISFMAEYSPEVPIHLLESLLLYKRLHIDRYIMVQNYILRRHVSRALPSIFEKPNTPQAFVIRCFDSSDQLQGRKEEIELSAEEEKNKKWEELKVKRDQYRSLVSQAKEHHHTYPRWESHEPRSCEKCRLENRAKALSVTPHEWPLPEKKDVDDIDAKWVVFELFTPSIELCNFKVWRSITYFLLHGLCQTDPPLPNEPAICVLGDYSSLRKFGDITRHSVTIASSTKSFERSHYEKPKPPSASEADIFLNNGLRFALYDVERARWIRPGQTESSTISKFCTWMIPAGSPYFHLSYALQIDRATNFPNRSIANQCDSPQGLGVQEHINYGTLRSTPRLQWLNIAREMRSRTLSFSRPEVRSLILQAALQVGPVTEGNKLEWHLLLEDNDFAERLLDEIDSLLNSIRENWAHIVSLETSIILILRLLASSRQDSPSVTPRAIDLLSSARRISLGWMHKFTTPSKDCKDTQPAVAENQHWICVMAAICRTTFLLDSCYLEDIFAGDSGDDVATFVESLIHLHDNQPTSPPAHLRHHIARNERLAHATEHHHDRFLRPNLQSQLEMAVATKTNILPKCRPEPAWKPADHPFNTHVRWLTCDASSNELRLQLHLDLSAGALLINGQPIGRLPLSITHHALYKRLPDLKERLLDVVQSKVMGMDYITTKEVFEGFHLLFNQTCDRNELIIRAARGSGPDQELYELIPPELFEADFPPLFVKDHCHWLLRTPAVTPYIEFRPFSKCWEPSIRHWRLSIQNDGRSVLQRAPRYLPVEGLIYKQHSIHHMVSTHLRGLERPEYLHLSLSDTGTLKVDLPRYKLSFTLEDGQLQSDNMRGMFVDPNQAFGTLCGLNHRLVLTSAREPFSFHTRSRCVIIPYREAWKNQQDVILHFNEDEDRVTVDVNIQQIPQVRYFKYDIDEHLHSLIGTTFLSEVYRAYLHALTSHHLPDPLLGHTGLEEALRLLRSAKFRSFQALSGEEVSLLEKLAGLAAQYVWYPRDLRVMQTVNWQEIRPLSQHWSLPRLVQPILEYHVELSTFEPSAQPTTRRPRDLLSEHAHLALRSSSQNCHLYAASVFHPDFEEFKDEVYTPLQGSCPQRIEPDRRQPRTDRARCISRMVQEWPQTHGLTVNEEFSLWDLLPRNRHGSEQIRSTLSGFTLSYDHCFLDLKLSEVLLPFYTTCTQTSQSTQSIQAQLAFTLPAIAYRLDNLDLVASLLAFASVPIFRQIQPPNPLWTSYQPSKGFPPETDRYVLIELIKGCGKRIHSLDQGLLPTKYEEETPAGYSRRRNNFYEKKTQEDSTQLADYLVGQWRPCPHPCQFPHDDCNTTFPQCPTRSQPYPYIDFDSLRPLLKEMFSEWHKNMHLSQFIREVQNCLAHHRSGLGTSLQPSPIPVLACPIDANLSSRNEPRKHSPWLTLFDIVCERRPPSLLALSAPEFPRTPSHSQLDVILDAFMSHPHASGVYRKFGATLRSSNDYLKVVDLNHSETSSEISHHQLRAYLELCNAYHNGVFDLLADSLGPDTGEIQDLSSHWPTITRKVLLKLLTFKFGLKVINAQHDLPEALPEEWHDVLRAFAISLLLLQRARRLLSWHVNDDVDDFKKEFDNNPTFEDQCDDWLLIQIEGNFLARPIQLEVAQRMINPSGYRNTVIQLNMGEGKTSVIVPLIASKLADEFKLVRVVVLKPLARSMFSLLVLRLSGLTNRRIFYLPFSRQVPINSQSAEQLRKLFELCRRERGILVAQPEHILSLKLIGIDLADKLSPENPEKDAVNTLLRLQQWLNMCSRDILDESDEILSVKYQLIYTSGKQVPPDHHPHRWLVIQDVLKHLRRRVRESYCEASNAIQVVHRPVAEFPQIRILDSVVGWRLINDVAKDIATDKFSRLELSERILEYITKKEANDKILYPLQNDPLWPTILLLRGLFAHGILHFLLKDKRYRVNYGLDLTRPLRLAVPYRAKDIPAVRADFGHPDVAIALTCLSHYEEGLTSDQLQDALHHLLMLDSSQEEYNNWLEDSPAKSAFATIQSINLKDPEQHKILYGLFNKNQAAIDFYLSQIVFPRDTKQFPCKLTTSAWDLAETKGPKNPTTGFSGTNDNQDLLPTSISTADPVRPETDALVLRCLLREENNHYLLVDPSKRESSSELYLEAIKLQSPPIRVLLDVGAQILDMDNATLARKWLELDTNIPAVVFFDYEDQLVVMTRDCAVETLELSCYSRNLADCAIYLDDAHTRGTDLKLPRDYRAAVTLGPKLTKDRLVQGCMRMRKLGSGQSVMFFAPYEVDNSIRKVALEIKIECDRVQTLDIIRWAIAETCMSIQHSIPHWAQQGVNYEKRKDAWSRYCDELVCAGDSPASIESSKKLRNGWEDEDGRSLQKMYGANGIETPVHPALGISDLKRRLETLGVHSIEDVGMEEEQEREVSHEAEEEGEVERPPPARPAEHHLDPDVQRLVSSGEFDPDSKSFVRMFSELPPHPILPDHWSSNLWSTRDFSNTIESSDRSDTRLYQRPVHWLLTTKRGAQIIALSPWEANELLPKIQKSSEVHLHMYAPRVNEALKSFEDLRFFVIPPFPNDWTSPSSIDIAQLNLWAGQLYFKDLLAYHDTRMVLGIVGSPDSESEKLGNSDGFVPPEDRQGRMKDLCRFDTSPLPYLQELASLRQKGKSYQSTHVGKILDGKWLVEADFECRALECTCPRPVHILPN